MYLDPLSTHKKTGKGTKSWGQRVAIKVNEHSLNRAYVQRFSIPWPAGSRDANLEHKMGSDNGDVRQAMDMLCG